MGDEMKRFGILFILVQIDEAHSSAWPIGLNNQPEPQASFEDRVDRANAFVETDNPPFPVYIDAWDNFFAETYRAWPDQYYCATLPNKKIIGKSEYGTQGENNALIEVDCLMLIDKLMKKKSFFDKLKSLFGQ